MIMISTINKRSELRSYSSPNEMSIWNWQYTAVVISNHGSCLICSGQMWWVWHLVWSSVS